MRDNTKTPPTQEVAASFWEEVALRIEKDFNLGHPSTWKQAQMEKFLQLFEEKIPSLIPANYDKLHNPGISVSTLRRIFIKKNSNGNVSNQDLFSWLLGYDSFQDYIIKQNEVIQEPVEKEYIKTKKMYMGVYVVSLVLIVILITWCYSSPLSSKSFDNNAIIQVIKNAMRVELEARRKVPDYEPYLDTLCQFFVENGPAYKTIEGNLGWQAKKSWVLSNPYNKSHNELLDIQIIEINDNEAIVGTKESWYIEWLSKKSHEIEYIYEELNNQHYTLVKNKQGIWKIHSNDYPSVTKAREIPSIKACHTKEVLQTIQLTSTAFGQELISIINTGAITLALVMLKCYCQDKGLEERYDRFLVLDMSLQELMQQLNTDKMDFVTYQKEKQDITEEILQTMRTMKLL